MFDLPKRCMKKIDTIFPAKLKIFPAAFFFCMVIQLLRNADGWVSPRYIPIYLNYVTKYGGSKHLVL